MSFSYCTACVGTETSNDPALLHMLPPPRHQHVCALIVVSSYMDNLIAEILYMQFLPNFISLI